MKILVYSFRDFDEKDAFDALCAQAGFDYVTCPDYPSTENAVLAHGCDAISIIVCDMNAALLEALAAQGVRYICTRSIGGQLRHHADAHGLPPLPLRARARAASGFFAEGQAWARAFGDDRGRDRAGAHRKDGACPPVGHWLPAAGL